MGRNPKMKGEAPTIKIAVGEVVRFADVAFNTVFTQYGETQIVNFADEDGKIFRKCFLQGGMADFFKRNPEAKSICLKKKLTDGELQFNVWSQE